MKYLYFYGDHCGPCKTFSPIMDQVSATGIPVQKINTDTQPNLVAQYGIHSIPTVILVNAQGQELIRRSGAQPKKTLIDIYKQNLN